MRWERVAWRLACTGVLIAGEGCERSDAPAIIAVAFNLTDSAVLTVADEELRAAGQSEGLPPISIVFESELPGEPPDAAVARAERLVALEGLIGVAGHGDSRSSLAAAQVYNTAQVPQVVPIGTNQELATAGSWTFTLAPNDSVEGHFIASYVAETLGARRVSLFFQNNDYGFGLRNGVMAGLASYGLQPLTEMVFERGGDFATLLAASLRQGRPDALIVAGYSRETIGIASAVHASAPGLRIVSGDGVLAGFGPALADSIGRAADSLFAVAFWVPSRPDAVSRRFVARFRELAGRDPAPSEAMLYDAIMVLGRAVHAVGRERSSIRSYLGELGAQRQALPGVTGSIAFGAPSDANLIMVKVRQGAPEGGGG